ncbi:MAG TPA: hypothetical protein VJ914_32155 [Pseudonocardiaceae bacterium]|nr:hypothetical protein [Pseudonocardiaceae bacterium]
MRIPDPEAQPTTGGQLAIYRGSGPDPTPKAPASVIKVVVDDEPSVGSDLRRRACPRKGSPDAVEPDPVFAVQGVDMGDLGDHFGLDGVPVFRFLPFGLAHWESG